MILRARFVATMDGPPISDGAVAIEQNRITAVGPWSELRSGHHGRCLDLGERVLMPGLINAHCHLDYTMLRGAIPPPSSFSAWISAINAHKASLAPDDYLHGIENGFAEALSFGTTTLANLEAFPELLASMSPPPLRTWWFAEMIDVRAPVSPRRIYRDLAERTRGAEWLGGCGLAPHAPFTASRTLYADANAIAAAEDLPLTTHLAESREEMLMFRDARGPLCDFLRSIGRPMDDCGELTPVGLLLKNELLNERWIVAHLNELTGDDLDLLAQAPKFDIVHCPRSHAYFAHAPFQLPELRARGLNICLGTDSLASNEDLSMFAEMRQLADTQPSLRAVEILALATVNGAAALGQQNELGCLRTGYLADIIALPCSSEASYTFDEILEFTGRVGWVMVNGQVLRDS